MNAVFDFAIYCARLSHYSFFQKCFNPISLLYVVALPWQVMSTLFEIFDSVTVFSLFFTLLSLPHILEYYGFVSPHRES